MTAEIFQRIEHSHTSDEVIARIEKLLLESVLRVGDRLPGERELARRFDVSRPILRKALKELEARGLLVSRHGGGTYVADIIGQVFAPPLSALIRRHHQTSHDYLEYRREVEGFTAQLAARRATEADRLMLTDLVVQMRAAHSRADFAEEAEVDVELHNAIGECAHNIVLLHTLRACYRLLSDGVFYNRSLIYSLPGARDALLTQHLAIAEAVIAGDAVAARTAAQSHIDFVTEAIEQAERSGDRERVARMRLTQRVRSTPAQLTRTDKAEAAE